MFVFFCVIYLFIFLWYVSVYLCLCVKIIENILGKEGDKYESKNMMSEYEGMWGEKGRK